MDLTKRTYVIIKKIFDWIITLFGLSLIFPVIIILMILIKITSKGPILYIQTRIGKKGRLFNIYKFRTMKIDAEKDTGPVWATKNDNRLTPIGNFLRKAHIDELPQLINILKGEMSLVGPRPERPIFVEKFKVEIPGYVKRLTVKPGITGLAQVWHKYDETVLDVKKKLKYDLLYIRKAGLRTDFNILLRTSWIMLRGGFSR